MRLRVAAVIAFGLSALILLFTSCGGGGGGADVGTVANSNPPPITYSGQTQAAQITTDNAKQLVYNVLGENESSGPISRTISTAENQAASAAIVSKNLRRLYRRIPIEEMRSDEKAESARAFPVNETEICPAGGSVTYTGSVNEDGTGEVDIVYRNCSDGEGTTDGSFHYRVDAFDSFHLLETDATISRINLAVTGPGMSYDLGGSVHIQVDLNSSTERVTENLVVRDNLTGIFVKSEDFKSVAIFDDLFSPTNYSMTVEGRIYDSRYGYVELTTLSPLNYLTMDQIHPDAGACLRLTGSGGASIVVTVLSGSILKIELDLDLDGAAELESVLPWQALNATNTTNHSPIANAGSDRSSQYLKAVVLYGSGSDPDYDFLHFTWSIIERPAGSAADIPEPNRLVASFIPDVIGEYHILLTVSDGLLQHSDEMILTALETAPQDILQQWGTYQGNAAHTGYVPLELDPADFGERWAVTLGDGSALNPVTAGDGRIYATTYTYFGTQVLYVLDAADGEVLWDRDFGDIHSIDPPAYADGRIYLQTGGHADSFLWAFNATDGTLAFKSAYGNQWFHYYAPTPYAEGVYVAGGYYGGAYGFNAQDGSQAWFVDLSQYDQFTPAVNQDNVFTYTEAALSVMDRISGAVIFEIPDPGFDWQGWSMNVAPVLGHMDNVLAIQAGRLISFDLTGRTIGWQIDSGFRGQPALGPGVICAINSGAVQALAEDTGNMLWSWAPPGASSITSNLIVTDTLLFAATGQTTYAVDLATHTEVWSHSAGGHLALSDGFLYIATQDGRLIAIFLGPSGT